MKYLGKSILTLIMIALVISGCLPKTVTPENDSVIPGSEISVTQEPINTLIPTNTQSPTNTISPTIKPTKTETLTTTPTPSATHTITPQPTKDYLKDAEILNVGYLGNNQLLVVLEAVSEIEDDYYASIADEEFQCEILDDYPNRLYCNGKSTKIGQLVVFVIHLRESNEEIFSVEIFVPELPTSTPKPKTENDGNGNEKPTDEPPPQSTISPEG